MNLPRGSLVRSRVVSDPGVALAEVLERRLTGYAVLEPQDSILLETDANGVLTFESGVPVLAYHAGTDRGGPSALADLAVPGPYSVDIYELDREELAEAHDTPELRVPPGMPADRLAADADLVDRTRACAPADRLRTGSIDSAGADTGTGDGPSSDEGAGAVEAFLADEETIEEIRRQAREEARTRAAEWGLDDELA